MEFIPKRQRVKGERRDKLGEELATKYNEGASVRALAEATGRSYGFVHRLLAENGVEFRSRGGVNRGKPNNASIT